MKSKELSLHKTLKNVSEGYANAKPDQESFACFKTELAKLVEAAQAKPDESEEFHKNLVSDFLKNTGYKQRFSINTKGRQDLVIHNGSDAKSCVGVIFETKSPRNKNEMLTKERLNVKALHELVYYYLQERITHKNLEVKHLIATKISEWFVFDVHEFDRIFAQNKKFVQQFSDFEAGRLADTTTDFFYKQVVAPFVDALSDEVEFTHINLADYATKLQNADSTGEDALIDLYKILSPEHLLKLTFRNDSNTLNKKFYDELLYIIGLNEVGQNGKTRIERCKEGERQSGALIEEIITQLKAKDKIRLLKNAEQYGSTDEDRLVGVALELAITWINRILFLKLLEAQLLSYHRRDEAYAFLSRKNITSYGDLDELFFQVLAVKQDERSADVNEKFASVPYLNSTLFAPTELEDATLSIDNLKNKSILIFPKTVLKDPQTNKKMRTGMEASLDYLFAFLNAYDFGSEHDNNFQNPDRLINASVLGLIFEKINGYKDGSFFTPGFITMYMCREAIRKAVVQKFNAVKNWNCKTLDDVYDKIDDTKEANDVVNSLKICDPAVGSGHFLVSALNELIAIKHDLKILRDSSGKRLKEYDIQIINDELAITDEYGKPFVYHFESRESQRVQETLFHEKQTIIENCLFGVDINSNSVAICRLRLWIELLKSAYYKNATELETLPNIDINIKCGNSLVSRFPIGNGKAGMLENSKHTIAEYRNAADAYRNAKSKEQKWEAERLIAEITSDIRTRLLQLRLPSFEEDEAAARKIYANAFEWRFEFPEVLNDDGEFVGFDVVIGNPPYVVSKDPYLRKRYEASVYGRPNLYGFFIHAAIETLLSRSGMLMFINPRTLLTDSYSSALRKFILQNASVHSVLNITERHVFDEVLQSCIVNAFTKNRDSATVSIRNIATKEQISTGSPILVTKDDFVFDATDDPIFIVAQSQTTYDIFKKISKCNSFVHQGLSFTTGKIQWDLFKDVLKAKPTKSSTRLIWAENIQRFEFADTRLRHDKQYITAPLTKCSPIEECTIVVQRTTAVEQERRIIATIVDPHSFGMPVQTENNTSYLEKKIPIQTENHTSYLEKNSSKINLSFILGLLNSKFFDFVFRHINSNTHVSAGELNSLPFPVPVAESKAMKSISQLVDRVLTAKTNDASADTAALESKIDQLVYELYGLTDDEVAIVENRNW